ncbi:hypothetical protein [Hymenobacter fodinae]|nr:hypothetical protein [Hymenobacter fodinae]
MSLLINYKAARPLGDTVRRSTNRRQVAYNTLIRKQVASYAATNAD